MATSPRLTFGLIVLNGEPFTRYFLRSVYPWAHQILITEGATRFSVLNAGLDGHSADQTLAVIRTFQKEEDVEKKVVLITAEEEGHPNGFWPGEKTQMCQAYAKRATGDFLVTLDMDEFFRDEDYPIILDVLKNGATHVTLKTIDFWGSTRYNVAGFWTISYREGLFRRIMAWGPGYRYVEHRPPTVVDAAGVNVINTRPVSAEEMARRGVCLYHFSHLLPSQVVRKSRYYSATGMNNLTAVDRWAKECYQELRRPFRVHNAYHHISWLTRYKGPLPEQTHRMMDDIQAGRIQVELRPIDDVERLLGRPSYMLISRMLAWWAYFITTPFGKWLHRWLNSIYIRLPRLFRIYDPPFANVAC
jgi:hypothetical protein